MRKVTRKTATRADALIVAALGGISVDLAEKALRGDRIFHELHRQRAEKALALYRSSPLHAA